jgi:hypothetical protein
MNKVLSIILLALTTCVVHGQEKETANTLKLSGNLRPKATIKEIAWLAGHWKGSALGGVTEEIWSPPMANSMMGSYRLIKNDTSVVFYEILAITEDKGSLTLRLKHFNRDLTGWEEKNEVREFKLVKAEKNKLWFEGMTFEFVDENTFQVFLAIQKKNGEVIEEIFRYKKASVIN